MIPSQVKTSGLATFKVGVSMRASIGFIHIVPIAFIDEIDQETATVTGLAKV